MSRTTQFVLYSVTGQTIAHRVPDGPPSVATFKAFWYWAGDDTPEEFSGSGTLDSYSQSPTASCGPSQADPQKISIVVAGLVLGRQYLLAEAQRSEWHVIVEIGSNYVRTRHPLKSDFTTAATLKSTYVTAAVDNTWIANYAHIAPAIDPQPWFRLRWALTVAGGPLVQYTFFDVLRQPVTHGVSIDDINARAPGLMDSLPAEYRTEQGRPLIDAAWTSVQADAATMGIGAQSFRDNQIVDELVILRSLSLFAEGGWRPAGWDSTAAYVKDRRDAYERFVERQLQATLKMPVAPDQTGSTVQPATRDFWGR